MLNYTVKITATGEVRDAEGNLLSESPVEATVVMSEAEVRSLFEGESS